MECEGESNLQVAEATQLGLIGLHEVRHDGEVDVLVLWIDVGDDPGSRRRLGRPGKICTVCVRLHSHWHVQSREALEQKAVLYHSQVITF